MDLNNEHNVYLLVAKLHDDNNNILFIYPYYLQIKI